MSALAVYLLGPPRVERDGRALELGASKNVALVAYLAVTGEQHTREAISTLLWPELVPSRGRANLRRNLSLLRGALGEEWLDADREHVGLASDGDLWLDVRAFRALLDGWRGHGHGTDKLCAQCLEDLSEAAGLYRGDFLAGFSLRDSVAYDDWQFFQGEGLRQEMASALERLVRGHCGRGAYAEAVTYARRWVALDPLHEPAHYLLMRLYARTGQRAAALRQYEECARLLGEEMGVAPSAETTQLNRAIVEGREGPSPVGRPLAEHIPTETVPERPSPTSSPRSTHNLPVQLAPFIGREAQLAEVGALLRRPEVRLLTLTGAGGAGKTRLALQAASEALAEYPDGVYLVELAPVRDPGLVVPAIAKTLGVIESGREPLLETVKYALRQRRLLLVLDNFEQVIAAAPEVSELLAAAPDLVVLATSRMPLRLSGEFEYPVPPMAVPGPEDLPPLERLAQVEAVRLFVARAEQVQPGFRLTEEAAPAVAEICARLDGLPLAVELAAARVRLLSPEAIVSRLAHGLAFLTGGARDVPARQRTVRATIAWSHDLLGEEERTLFAQLGVFAGEFTLQAAEAVVVMASGAPVLDGLESLVEQSLLQVTAKAPEPRFRMLEVMREYALERLAERDEEETTRERHAQVYLALAEGGEVGMRGPDAGEWIERLEAAHGNLRAALSWSMERPCELGPRLAGALGWFWYQRFYFSEGLEWLARALEKCRALGREADPAQAKALMMAAGLHSWGESTLFRSLMEASVRQWRAVGDERGLARALVYMTNNALWQNDLDEARLLAEEGVALCRRTGDVYDLAAALHQLATVSRLECDYEGAAAILEESLALARETGSLYMIAHITGSIGRLALDQGEHADGRSAIEHALALYRKAGHAIEESFWLLVLGASWYAGGERERARAFWEESLAIMQRGSNKVLIAQGLYSLAFVSLAEGDGQRAGELLTESLALVRASGRGHGGEQDAAWCFVGLAGVAAQRGQTERAARLLGAAGAIMYVRIGDWPRPFDTDREAIESAMRDQLGEKSFASAWEEARALAEKDWTRAVAYALQGEEG
jgi:predicted ATPase/DNA-binding SARP family transcriptional activator